MSPEPEVAEKLLEVRYEFTPLLPEILTHLKTSLMVTTYQAGKLLVLGVDRGKLRISFSSFDQPMGLALAGEKLAIGTRRQINCLAANREVAPSVEPAGTWDVCYVPRTSTWTGSIHGHDLAWGTDGLWVVNTLFSCLSTLHEDYSFVPRWKPGFISQLMDQDRCHLNGLAVVEGRPGFVTAMAETDTAAGWRPTKATSGVVIDVSTGETVSRGLAMPHSPRWYNGRLWVLDSGRGTLGVIDLSTGRVETVETFPGYTRGLSFCGQFAFVGLSRIRETSVFGGVPIAEHREQLKCGVGVVDLISGRTVAVFQFLSGVTEIFAVEAADSAACPYVAGASTDGREHDVWIVPQPGHLPSLIPQLPWYSGKQHSLSPGNRVRNGHDSPPAAQSRRDPEAWLQSHPDDAAGWVALGNLRQEQDRQGEAVECYERAVAADPKMTAARQNLGYLLFNQGHPERSREVYSELLQIDPSPMNRLLAASVLPVIYGSSEELLEWRQRQAETLRRLAAERVIVDATRQLVPTAFFWPYQGLNDCQVMATRGQVIQGDLNGPRVLRPGSDSRIRVGFLSAYFRNHTIGRLNLGRVEHLDRSRFHVTVCSAFQGTDEFVRRFQNAADAFVQIPRDVSSAIRLLREQNLEILVFTDVGMDALTSTLSFSRMAPIQCATWGHPETTGSPAIDAYLSSELLETPEADTHYTETLVRLPLIGTWYERPSIPVVDGDFLKRLGIVHGQTVYACPQSLFKFHPDNDQIMRRLLQADRSGVIVVIEGRVPEWTSRLRARWQQTLGGHHQRVLMIPALEHTDYLRLLRMSDVVLDPLHFGGGNSSFEALAMEVPVVTLPGEFLRSRITAALYHKMNFHECIAHDPEAYVQTALRLGSDPVFRSAICREIRERSSVLFSDPAEIRCLEEALANLVKRH